MGSMGDVLRWRTALLAAACALAVASCSSEPEAVGPTLELSTTTITTLPPTTAEAPTMTEDPRIAEVEAAVAAFHEQQSAVLANPSASLDRLKAVTGAELFGVIEANLLLRRAEGRTSEGSFTLSPVETEIVSEFEAVQLSCGLDGLAGVSASGEVIVDADETAFLREYSVARSSKDEGWRIAAIVFPGSEKVECDL